MDRRSSLKAAVLGFFGGLFSIFSKPVAAAPQTSTSELDGMAALAAGIANQVFPHTVDARVWAKEFNQTLAKLGHQTLDEGWLIGWFANAIMAGHDTATMRAKKAPFHSTTKNFAFFCGGSLTLDEEGEKRNFHRVEFVSREELLKENKLASDHNETKTRAEEMLPYHASFDRTVVLKLFYMSKSKTTGKTYERWFRVWLSTQTGSLQEILTDFHDKLNQTFKAIDSDFAPGGVYNRAPKVVQEQMGKDWATVE